MSITDKTISNIPAEQIKDADSISMFDENGAFLVARLSDSEAPNGSIYFSNDQTALVYKDGAGEVWTLDMSATP